MGNSVTTAAIADNIKTNDNSKLYKSMGNLNQMT